MTAIYFHNLISLHVSQINSCLYTTLRLNIWNRLHKDLNTLSITTVNLDIVYMILSLSDMYIVY